MAKKRAGQGKLSENHKVFLVQQLACFESVSEAAAALREQYGISITDQSAEHYDPTKYAGRNLAKKFKALFESTREAFLKDAKNFVGISNKSVRLRKLAKAADKFERAGNLVGMASILEQAAKEMGGSFTNRRELTGKGGGPVEMRYSDMTDEEIDQRLAQLAEQGRERAAADDRPAA